MRTKRASWKTNHEEAVFLRFRSYRSSDQQDTVDLVQTSLDSHLFKASATPVFAYMALRDLAGKAVAVFHKDYGNLPNPMKGTFPYSDYGNEDSGASTPRRTLLRGLRLLHQLFRVRGHEVQPDGQIPRPRGNNKNYLFLLSCTLTGYIPDQIMDLELLSNAANSQLPKTLKRVGQVLPNVRPNIVYIDNVDPWICRPIIVLNPGM